MGKSAAHGTPSRPRSVGVTGVTCVTTRGAPARVSPGGRSTYGASAGRARHPVPRGGSSTRVTRAAPRRSWAGRSACGARGWPAPSVGQRDQLGLAPLAADERHADRQVAVVAGRHGDARVARDRRRARRPDGEVVAVDQIGRPRRGVRRRDDRVQVVLAIVESIACCAMPAPRCRALRYAGSVSGPRPAAARNISWPNYCSSCVACALSKAIRSCEGLRIPRRRVVCRYCAMSCLNSYSSAVFSGSYAASIGMLAGSTMSRRAP